MSIRVSFIGESEIAGKRRRFYRVTKSEFYRIEKATPEPDVVVEDEEAKKARGYNPYRDPKSGKFTSGGGAVGGGTGGGGGAVFASPSVQDKDFNEAVAALNGERQRTLGRATDDINHQLGLNATRSDAIGAWEDGAENSFITSSDGEWDSLVASGAMQGHLGNQKSALIWQSGDGPAIRADFDAQGDLGTIHSNLLSDGVDFHTLTPVPGGARVTVISTDGSRSVADAVNRSATRYGSTVTIQSGRAEFIGGSTRQGARAEYESILAQSGVQGVQEVWRGVSDRWGPTLNALEKAKDALLKAHGYDLDTFTKLAFSTAPAVL